MRVLLRQSDCDVEACQMTPCLTSMLNRMDNVGAAAMPCLAYQVDCASNAEKLRLQGPHRIRLSARLNNS